jgi:hypothetical protein
MPAQWQCSAGRTVLIPSGPRENHKHLFALMLDPVVVAGYGTQPCVLLACVSSIRDGEPFDEACQLHPGEHPFITHPSFVDYRFTRIEQAAVLDARVQDGSFIEKDPCSSVLLKKIINGALNSRRINREFKKILEKIVFR